MMGRLLLQKRDESGIGYLEKVMAEESDAIPPACDLIFGYPCPSTSSF
jgi:hypothetical protein